MERNTAQASLVERGSGITHPFERSRWLFLTAGLRDLRTAEPQRVLSSARNDPAGQLGLSMRIRARSMALRSSCGRSGASPHQKSDPDTSQYSNTPALRHSTRPDSRTAARLSSPKSCPTKPTLYIATRSRSASQARRAPQQNVGEVGRTTKDSLPDVAFRLGLPPAQCRARKRGVLTRRASAKSGERSA